MSAGSRVWDPAGSPATKAGGKATVPTYRVLESEAFRLHTNVRPFEGRSFSLAALPSGTRFDRPAVLTFHIDPSDDAHLALRVFAIEGVDPRNRVFDLRGGVSPRPYHVVISADHFDRNGHVTIAVDFGGSGSVLVEDVMLWFEEVV
jgi:hypothetical protein